MELVQIEPARRLPAPKPEWLKARAPVGENYHELKRLARSLGLNTVCESAQCPNIGECWHHKTATFMMLGNLCPRGCCFCAYFSQCVFAERRRLSGTQGAEIPTGHGRAAPRGRSRCHSGS